MALIRTSGGGAAQYFECNTDYIVFNTVVSSSSYAALYHNGSYNFTASGLPTIPADFFANVTISGNDVILTYREAGEYSELITIGNMVKTGVVNRAVGDTITLNAASGFEMFAVAKVG